MKRNPIVSTAGVLLLALLLGAPLAAQTDSQNDDGTNVLVTFRMGTLEGEKKTTVKSYSLIVRSGPAGSSLLSGQRVAFPTSGGANGDGSQTWVYQNIGFSTEVHVRVIGKKRIMINATIENSRVETPAEVGLPPSVETRQLAVSAILTDGISLELTRVEGITDERGWVEVEATVLR